MAEEIKTKQAEEAHTETIEKVRREIRILAVFEEILGQERCIKQLALIAVRNVKFRSNQHKDDLFIAGIATRNTSAFSRT